MKAVSRGTGKIRGDAVLGKRFLFVLRLTLNSLAFPGEQCSGFGPAGTESPGKLFIMRTWFKFKFKFLYVRNIPLKLLQLQPGSVSSVGDLLGATQG